MISIKLAEEDIGKRIDRIVRKELSFCPLGEIFRLFRNGKIKLNGKKQKENSRVTEIGEIQIFADVEGLRERFSEKQSQKNSDNFVIIYEDTQLLVCDKPVGVATQPGKGILEGASLIEMAQNYANEKYTPHLAHRIDQDTSGIILIAKNVEILRQIQNIWDSDLVKKEYLTICHNAFEKKSGKIELNLQKSGQIMEVVERGGQSSLSYYKVISQTSNLALVSVEIKTGRMHQIRAQFSHLNHNILGDKKYGNEELDREVEKKLGLKINRLMLHSNKISFVLGKKQYKFEAKKPAVFEKFL